MPARFFRVFVFVAAFAGAPALVCAAPQSKALDSALVQLAPRLSRTVARLATQAVTCAASQRDANAIDTLAIIDYSLPSTEKRFWLFDVDRVRLLIEDLVAHGKNSGENAAVRFSNDPGSLQSSLGLFQVGARYVGKHGDSLRLIGLEQGINDLAEERAIVIHGADYVGESFIKLHQRLGRSFGCPALAPQNVQKVIHSFRNGNGYLFSYYPDQT